MMYQKLLVVAVFVLTLFVCTVAIANSFSVTPKPQAPVRISIQSQSPVGGQSEVNFTVTVQSVVDINEAQIAVKLPENVSLLSGPLAWSGDLRGGSQSLEFTLNIDTFQSFTLDAQFQGVALNQRVLTVAASFDYLANRFGAAIAQKSRQRTVNRQQGTAIEYTID